MLNTRKGILLRAHRISLPKFRRYYKRKSSFIKRKKRKKFLGKHRYSQKFSRFKRGLFRPNTMFQDILIPKFVR